MQNVVLKLQWAVPLTENEKNATKKPRSTSRVFSIANQLRSISCSPAQEIRRIYN